MMAGEIRTRRRGLALTQDQFARALGVSSNTVSRWERGTRAISRPDLVRIAIERLENPRSGSSDAHSDVGAPLVDRVPSHRTHNLPVDLSSFVGRQAQLHDLVILLSSVRLLTLAGAGGVGKTRLAVRLGHTVLENYPDGVWLAELGSLADPGLLDSVICSVLGVAPRAGRPLRATLADALRSKRLLLILDNCEHVVAGAADVAEALLQASPDLRILTTSREPLRLPGETVWRVPSLSLPDPTREPRLDVVLSSEAVQLFCERARQVDPAFSLTERDSAAVAQVCQELDGIPLAIELAAARVEMLSVSHIASRLADRFQLLIGNGRTAPPRQRTLRAAVAWSYELLDERERRLLARLSVFADGWTPEAADAICADGDIPTADVLGVLGHLVSKSLVQVEHGVGAVRHRLLETIRQFAAEQLHSNPDDELRCLSLHRDWFLALAEDAAKEVPGPSEMQALDLLDSELDNLRIAFDRCGVDAASLETGLRVAGRLWWFWWMRNHWREGRALLEKLLARATPGVDPAARAEALFGLAVVLRAQGELPAARTIQQESLEIRRAIGDQFGEARSLGVLGRIVRDLGEYDTAQALLQQALTAYERVGNMWGVARQLNGLGQVARLKGDFERAWELCSKSLALSRSIEDRMGVSIDLQSLGIIAYHRREIGLAAQLATEGLTLQRELRSPHGVLDCLLLFARLALMQRHPERAALLFGAADRLGQSVGYFPDWHPAQDELRLDIAKARDDLGESAFEAAWTIGRSLQLDEVIDFARTSAVERHPAATAPRSSWRSRDVRQGEVARVVDDGLTHDDIGATPRLQQTAVPLTARQAEVAVLIAAGLTNREIASRLVVTERAVAAHVERIFDRLRLTSRTQVAVWVAEHGLLVDRTG